MLGSVNVQYALGSGRKGHAVLGAQASSPARVQSNQLFQLFLVSWDMGRRGRLRSQDRGAFMLVVLYLVVTQPTRTIIEIEGIE